MMNGCDADCVAKLAIAVDALVAALDTRSGALRRRARRALEEIGEPAIQRLAEGLEHDHHRVRWEAAVALGHMAAAVAAPALVSALQDQDSGVRWVAAEALSALGPASYRPLVRALIADPSSSLLRHGAHHVLRETEDTVEGRVMEPLLAALDERCSDEQLILVAHSVLKSLGEGRVPTE